MGPYTVGLNTQNLLAILSIIVLTWVNLRGIRTGALVQNVLTLTKTGALLGVIVLGVVFDTDRALTANFGHFWEPAQPGTGRADWVSLLTMISVAMVGLGHSGGVLMAIAVMISTFGCNNGLILAGARIYYAMAKDRMFFASVGALNRHLAPSLALLMQGAWASVLCLSGTYGQLL